MLERQLKETADTRGGSSFDVGPSRSGCLPRTRAAFVPRTRVASRLLALTLFALADLRVLWKEPTPTVPGARLPLTSCPQLSQLTSLLTSPHVYLPCRSRPQGPRFRGHRTRVRATFRALVRGTMRRCARCWSRFCAPSIAWIVRRRRSAARSCCAGSSWIVEPAEGQVVIAIEIPMGAAIAGPFAIAQADLDAEDLSVLRPQRDALPRRPSTLH